MRHVYMKDMRHVQRHLVMSCSCEMFDVRFLHLSGGRVGIVHSLTVHGLMRRGGSPKHRGLTAASSHIILGHSTVQTGYLRTGYFSLGFCCAILLVVWILSPRFHE